MLNFNVEKITANTILNEFEIAGYESTSFSMLARLVFGSYRVGRPNTATILTKKQLLVLMQKLYEKILLMQNNRISRSLAWPIGLIFAQLNMTEDSTIINMKSGAIIDYSRLSLENSFLRATFDLLQTHIRNGCNDDAQFILHNIIYKVDYTFPIVDWSFLLRVCKPHSDYINTLTFCLRQCGTGSPKSILTLSLEVFNACLGSSPSQTLSNTIFGRILELGLKEQVFSPTEMKQAICQILILLQKAMINSDWLQILRLKMTQAPKSPQYDAICHELLSYIKNLSGKVKDYKTVRHIQFLLESAWNYPALDQLVSPCQPSDMQESQLWIMASLSVLKPELTDNFINLLDSLAEKKLHLHTISYIAMIIPIQIQEIYMLKLSSTLKLDQIQTKWITKILNLTLAVSQGNKYLAKYYFKFVLLPMLYFMYYPSTEIDFHAIDYDLVRAGGFRRLLLMNPKGTDNLLDVIFSF